MHIVREKWHYHCGDISHSGLCHVTAETHKTREPSLLPHSCIMLPHQTVLRENGDRQKGNLDCCFSPAHHTPSAECPVWEKKSHAGAAQIVSSNL